MSNNSIFRANEQLRFPECVISKLRLSALAYSFLEIKAGRNFQRSRCQAVLFYICCASSRDRDQSILRFCGRPPFSSLLLCHTPLLLDLASADHRSEQIRLPKGENSPTAWTNGLSPFLPFSSGLAYVSGHSILTLSLPPHTTALLCITLDKVGVYKRAVT